MVRREQEEREEREERERLDTVMRIYRYASFWGNQVVTWK